MLPLHRALMDSEANPLRCLPPAQRFQVMVFLSVMLTTLFSVGGGAWLWYGEPVILRMLVVFGFLMTGLTCYRASTPARYRGCPAESRAARYDDAWGA